MLFGDIINIDFGKTSLKVIGADTTFKIMNISNVEALKNAIMKTASNIEETVVDDGEEGNLNGEI